MDGKDVNNVVPAPARIIQQFLCFMGGLLGVTLVVGQLNLPFYGATLWDLGAAMLARAYEWGCSMVPEVVGVLSGRFPVVVGALGVLWLTTIHLRVQRTGRYAAGFVDLLFTGCALGGLVGYFYFLDRVLPVDATFFYRVVLYCAIAVLTFGVSAAASAVSGPLEKSVGIGEEWPFVLILIGGLFIGLGTGVQGEGFRFSGINVVLHLSANFGAAVMGIAYEGRVSTIARQGDKAKATAEQAAAGAK